MATQREVSYAPIIEDEFGEVDEDFPETRRLGYFEFWSIRSEVTYHNSPIGVIPLSISYAVGIIRDKTTGKCCEARVSSIKFL